MVEPDIAIREEFWATAVSHRIDFLAPYTKAWGRPFGRAQA